MASKDCATFYDFMEQLANASYTNFVHLNADEVEEANIDRILSYLQLEPDQYMSLIYNLTKDNFYYGETDYPYETAIRTEDDEALLKSRLVLTEHGLCVMTNSLLDAQYSAAYMITGQLPELRTYFRPVFETKSASFFESGNNYFMLGYESFVVRTIESIVALIIIGYILIIFCHSPTYIRLMRP